MTAIGRSPLARTLFSSNPFGSAACCRSRRTWPPVDSRAAPNCEPSGIADRQSPHRDDRRDWLMKYCCDLAISAVPTDAGFVLELVAQLAGRLGTAPTWESDGTSSVDATAAVLLADHSRVALVLHQHLWRHDERTRVDATVLQDRIRKRPESVCVMALDSAPVPSWLADAPRYDVAARGRAAAAEFVLGAIASAGGSVGAAEQEQYDTAPERRWPDPPTPYLSQPRAHSALRH